MCATRGHFACRFSLFIVTGLYLKSRKVARPTSLARTPTPSTTSASVQPPSQLANGGGESDMSNPNQASAAPAASSSSQNQHSKTTDAPSSSAQTEGSALQQKSTSTTKPASATGAHTSAGGTCPGDGRCDGTGGSSACAGCPTLNNSLAVSGRLDTEPATTNETTTAVAQVASPAADASSPGVEADSPAPAKKAKSAVGALSCANCGTSTTPLWRRDDVGNNICNACGAFLSHFMSAVLGRACVRAVVIMWLFCVRQTTCYTLIPAGMRACLSLQPSGCLISPFPYLILHIGGSCSYWPVLSFVSQLSLLRRHHARASLGRSG